MRIGNWEIPFLFAKKPTVVESEEAKPAAPKGEVGWSESLLYAKSSWPKFNPDELLGLKGARVYRKMMTDEQVKAVIRFKRDAITARRWYFEYDKKDIQDAQKQSQADPTSEEGTLPKAESSPDPSGAQYRACFDTTPIPPKQQGKPNPDDPAQAEGEEGVDPNQPGAEETSALSEEQELRIRVCEQIIEQIEGSFLDGLNGIMSAMYHGFSMVEKVTKDIEVDGKTWIGLKRLALKPFESFYFHTDEFGNIFEVTQKWEGREQTIDMERFVHHVQNPDVDQHYGQSELREAYRAWFSKDMAIRFFNIHLERHASGFIWVAPKEGVSLTVGSAEYNSLVQVLQNITAKTAIILPSGMELNYEQPANTEAYQRAIGMHDAAIAKALLVPNLLGVSEQGDKGSYGQSQTQLEAFLWTLDADAARLAETLNEKVFKPLCELNFGSGPYPKFCFKPISDALKLQIIKTWKELVGSKAVTPTDADESHIREMLDFPEAGEMLQVAQPAPTPGMPGAEGEMDPSTGKPITGMNEKGKAPIGKGKDAKKPGKPDETMMGQRQVKIKRAYAASARAAKRVDFSVIDNKGTQITGLAATRMVDALKEGIEEIKTFITDENVIGSPDKVATVKLSARLVTRMRKLAHDALKQAWELGQQHAKREMEKARGSTFAADELRLREEAAEKFLESRAYTIAGDLADSTRKKVATVLYNGIKGAWPLKEILDRIEDEIGAGVLPHASTAIRTTVFEAINEARYDLFSSPEMSNFVEALEFSAIIDGKTTEVCQHMDGRVYPTGDDVWDHYTPPLHFNCRSLLVAVTVRDNWERSDDPDIEPEDGFGG